MKRLALATIRTDGDTQTRVAMDVAAITDYAGAMADGVVFPAIGVYQDGRDFWLADGFHRVAAARKAHLTTLAADVRKGSRRDSCVHPGDRVRMSGPIRRSADPPIRRSAAARCRLVQPGHGRRGLQLLRVIGVSRCRIAGGPPDHRAGNRRTRCWKDVIRANVRANVA
jgi:hypothetical protein